jgi:hypothetical protein
MTGVLREDLPLAVDTHRTVDDNAGGAAVWPLAARAQQPARPVIGFLSTRSPAADARLLISLRQGLSESGFVEGRNVAIEYRYVEVKLIGCRHSQRSWSVVR